MKPQQCIHCLNKQNYEISSNIVQNPEDSKFRLKSSNDTAMKGLIEVSICEDNDNDYKEASSDDEIFFEELKQQKETSGGIYDVAQANEELFNLI